MSTVMCLEYSDDEGKNVSTCILMNDNHNPDNPYDNPDIGILFSS